MKKELLVLFSIFLTFLISCSSSTPKTQEEHATGFIDLTEKGEIEKAKSFLDTLYLNKSKSKIFSLLNKFITDFRTLEAGTQRYLTLVGEPESRTYRFRYIKNGTELQLDISYAENKKNRIGRVELIDRSSFKKMRIDHREPYPITTD
jgi:hypothetical protein